MSPIRFLKYRAYQETLIFKYPFSDKKKKQIKKKKTTTKQAMERRELLKIHIIFRFLVSLVSYTQEKASPRK